MTVRNLIQLLLLNGNLDDEVIVWADYHVPYKIKWIQPSESESNEPVVIETEPIET